MSTAPVRLAVRLSGLAIAITVAGLGLAGPAAATTQHAATPGTVSAPDHGKPAKVSARPDKTKVKKGEHVKVRGTLDALNGGGATAATTEGTAFAEPVIVQELRAGVWVNIGTTACARDGSFVFDLSFNISASLQLRVFHPETDLFAAAYSNVFILNIL